MINDLIFGITSTIDDAFGGKYPIRLDSIDQGGSGSRFHVKPLNPVIKKQMDAGLHVKCPFDIRFISGLSGGEEVRDLQDAQFVLSLEMYQIRLLDGRYRNGYDINSTIVDGILHFFVTYDLHLRGVEEKVFVQQLEQYKGVK